MATTLEFDNPVSTERRLEFDDPQPSRKTWKDKILGSADTLHEFVGGISEPIARIGSSMVAHPLGLIAGVDKGLYDTGRRIFGLGQQGPDAQEMRDLVTSSLTYAPRTKSGESSFNPLNAIANAAGSAIEAISPSSPEKAGVSPSSLEGALRIGAREAIPQAMGILGAKFIPPAIEATGKAAKRGAQSTMVNAIKATQEEIASGDAAIAAQQLLKRGINPNTAGLTELNTVIKDLYGQVDAEIAGSTASVSKQAIIDSLSRVRDKFLYRPNFETNQSRITQAVDEIVNSPVAKGDAIPVQVAQKLKQGYQQAIADEYGAESSAGIEANKQIARSLRQQIEAAHPEVAPLNAEQAAAITAADVIRGRAAKAQNEGLVPHVSPIGGAAAQMALIINRNPWLRSNIAHGLNKVGDFLSPRQVITETPGVIPWIKPLREESPSAIGISPEQYGIDYSKFAQEYRALKALDAKSPDTFIAREQAGNSQRQWLRERSKDTAAQVNRQPSGEGMPFNLDQVTGRLRPADAGLKGATPAAMESSGNNLASAVDKLSSGRGFSMTSEERVAWNARKVELAQAAPELRGLSDSAIADKVANRQWVDNRIQQLRTEYADWAEAAAKRFREDRTGYLNELANNPSILTRAERVTRATMNSEAARRMDLAQRIRKADVQKQIDALESMSDQLSATRAGTLRDIGQGPKTRNLLRNLLQSKEQ